MACCAVSLQLCDSGNDNALVVGYLDVTSGDVTYLNPDGTAFAGNESDLVVCPAGSSSNRVDADFCKFEVGGEIAPRIVLADGSVTEAVVVTAVASSGGTNTFEASVNGTVVGTAVLADGSQQQQFSGLPWTVDAGDIIQIAMTGTDATTDAGVGVITLEIS